METLLLARILCLSGRMETGRVGRVVLGCSEDGRCCSDPSLCFSLPYELSITEAGVDPEESNEPLEAGSTLVGAGSALTSVGSVFFFLTSRKEEGCLEVAEGWRDERGRSIKAGRSVVTGRSMDWDRPDGFTEIFGVDAVMLGGDVEDVVAEDLGTSCIWWEAEMEVGSGWMEVGRGWMEVGSGWMEVCRGCMEVWRGCIDVGSTGIEVSKLPDS